jgi:hypothetical protein
MCCFSHILLKNNFILLRRFGRTWAMAFSSFRFINHTQQRKKFDGIPLDELSARGINLYLTRQNTHNKHPWLRRDSNQHNQQVSGRRPTPQTARPMGPAAKRNKLNTKPNKTYTQNHGWETP